MNEPTPTTDELLSRVMRCTGTVIDYVARQFARNGEDPDWEPSSVLMTSYKSAADWVLARKRLQIEAATKFTGNAKALSDDALELMVREVGVHVLETATPEEMSQIEETRQALRASQN